jgi:protein-tyrosine phosphatase
VLFGVSNLPSSAQVKAQAAAAQEKTSSTSADLHFSPYDHIWLEREFWNLEDSLPHDYRTMQTTFEKKVDPNGKTGVVTLPTRQGMADLNVSGSGVFSRKSLKLLQQRLPKGFKLMVVDLMQESHGFVNKGLGVTWYCGQNQINWGKTDEQIRQDENSRLHSLLHEREATTYQWTRTNNPQGLEIGIEPIKIKIDSVETEEALCHSMGVEYIRIPVPDDKPPPIEEIDRFVNLVEHLDQNTWLHIHCAAGDGRTTTFMAFFDMMHNARDVSFDDIIERQYLIGGFQLMGGMSTEPWKIPYEIQRRKVIQDFYNTWQHKQL